MARTELRFSAFVMLQDALCIGFDSKSFGDVCFGSAGSQRDTEHLVSDRWG